MFSSFKRELLPVKIVFPLIFPFNPLLVIFSKSSTDSRLIFNSFVLSAIALVIG